MVRKAVVALTAIALACAPTGAMALDESLEMAGPYPENYDQIITAYLKQHLRDPFSAVVEVTRPPRLASYYAARTIWGKGKGYANWIVCFNLNAKNGAGGYVGFKPYALFIRDGKAFNNGDGEYGAFEPIAGDLYAEEECSIPASINPEDQQQARQGL